MSTITASSAAGADQTQTQDELRSSEISSSLPTSPHIDPPPYSVNMTLSAESNYGFPSGYFIIRSLSAGRLFDIELDDVNDGAEVILWPEKESSLVEGFRKPEADNQVFFIDTTGSLCSRQSGHAIDVEDGRLVLRHRRPKSYPYPNAYSHPLPRYHYSSITKQILVEFECDPSYPPPNPHGPPSLAWRQKSYFLSSVPLRKPRTLMEDMTEAVSNVFATPLTPFATLFGKAPATAEDVYRSDIDLREDEVLEEDRAEGEEVDDSPENIRRVRVVGVTEGENRALTEAAKLRRKWEVLPIRRSRALYTRQ